ncbi:ABC transporter permease [bacterium]|nr:ABC transporter permease [bacterium]
MKRLRSDRQFMIVLVLGTVVFIAILLSMVGANVWVAWGDQAAVWRTLRRAEIRQAIWLSIGTSLLSTVISLWLGTGVAYLVSRHRFFGRGFIDLLMDLPVFLPPLVIGMSLLILFRQTPLVWLDDWLQIAFAVPAIILAQTVVGTAFVYRTMRATFDQQTGRAEAIAATLGASRWQVFCSITLPASKQGLLAAAAIAWARAFGEFGPVLVFAGSFRGRTEVLPVSIYLELNSGNVAGAAAISLLMILIAAIVLLSVRLTVSDRSRP